MYICKTIDFSLSINNNNVDKNDDDDNDDNYFKVSNLALYRH